MQVKLIDHQYRFITSKKKFCLLAGGVGSGKTYCGAWYVINKCVNDGKGKGFIGANTYKQLRNATLTGLFRELDQYSIPFKYVENKGQLNINGTEILALSLENYDYLRGIEISWCWLDECAYTSEDAWNIIIGRMRDKRSKIQARLTSSPAGYNWLYDYFQGEKKTDEYEMINAATIDNPHLPQSYVNTLLENYDVKLAEQEIYGKFVNVGAGRVYYAFSRENNVFEIKYDPQLPVWVGMDFNINPMSAVACQIHGDVIKVIKEYYIMTSNTDEMAKEIKKDFTTATIIPDATGKAIKTSAAGISDHDILRSHGFVIPPVSNPFRMDRYNCVNNLLEKKRIMIDNKCKHLTKDLEQVSYKDGVTIPDTSDKTLTHISDALGYLAFYLFGLKKQTISFGRWA